MRRFSGQIRVMPRVGSCVFLSPAVKWVASPQLHIIVREGEAGFGVQWRKALDQSEARLADSIRATVPTPLIREKITKKKEFLFSIFETERRHRSLAHTTHTQLTVLLFQKKTLFTEREKIEVRENAIEEKCFNRKARSCEK